mmetsp:Transcript_85074/g.249160  ORF Transcript_85074/g.249160 Transcript_85074/m.249160 type:complete len:272 (-) Transcript_85074:263-1078(-)
MDSPLTWNESQGPPRHIGRHGKVRSIHRPYLCRGLVAAPPRGRSPRCALGRGDVRPQVVDHEVQGPTACAAAAPAPPPSARAGPRAAPPPGGVQLLVACKRRVASVPKAPSPGGPRMCRQPQLRKHRPAHPTRLDPFVRVPQAKGRTEILASKTNQGAKLQREGQAIGASPLHGPLGILDYHDVAKVQQPASAQRQRRSAPRAGARSPGGPAAPRPAPGSTAPGSAGTWSGRRAPRPARRSPGRPPSPRGCAPPSAAGSPAPPAAAGAALG